MAVSPAKIKSAYTINLDFGTDDFMSVNGLRL